MKRLLLILGLLLAAWVGYGAAVRIARAPRVPAPPGEARGAWHVHTTHSDGRGTLAEVVRAAREAGLQFVVVADHNVLTPGDAGYRDGVLVVEATEVSTDFGHVVALGVPRALTEAERHGDPLAAIAALGGEAVIAHPFHPRRPFTGWGRGSWRGLEIVSNDAAWHAALADHAYGSIALGLLRLPWDPARAVLGLVPEPSDELARFDAELRAAPRRPPGRGPARLLFCSADAHGYPSYRAAFEAFSMHVPVALSGDAGADARAVSRALLDGSASCVLDGVAPAARVLLAREGAKGLALFLDAPALASRGWAVPGPAAVVLVKDGAVIGRAAPSGNPAAGRIAVEHLCPPDGCAPGAYRAEVRLGDRPWIFTNPVVVE